MTRHHSDISLPGNHIDLQDPQVVIDLFQQATEANLKTNDRNGAMVELPDHGRLIMTGDLHDHGLNLQRILKLAALHQRTDHYLILHEVLHGPGKINGRDVSIRTLARIAATKINYPHQLLLLFGNHELAQLGGEGILKEGINVVESFDQGIEYLYDDHADSVRTAMKDFLKSMLLAVRCRNGVFCAHSLPAPRHIEKFDKTVIFRRLEEKDLTSPGSAYLMVWGRYHNQTIASELADTWNVKTFILGHQPAMMGYEVEADSILILASDHNHGVAVPVELNRTYSRDELVELIVPLASIALR